MIWRSSFNSKIAQFADFITVLFGLILSYVIWDYIHYIKPSFLPPPIQINFDVILIAVFVSIIYTFIFKNYKAYSYQRFTSLITEFTNIFKVSIIILIGLVFIFYLLVDYRLPRTSLFLPFSIIILFLMLEKSLLYLAANYIRQKGRNRKRVVLIGTGTRAKIFIDVVNKNFSWGLDIIGLLSGDKENVGKLINGIKVLDVYSNIERILKKLNPEEIIITLSTKRFDKLREVFEICEREGVKIRLNSDFFGKLVKNVRVDKVFGLNIITIDMVNHSETKLFIKRILDIVVSILAMFFFLPFMIIAAIGILISDGRPVLYSWNVLGLNKKPFKSWKFRTMVKDADAMKSQLINKNEMNGPVFKIKNDPRIIPFGKFLRKWSIDETPQLFSVLKGDMSLVGPRPAGLQELINYESWQRRKLSVKPGITCLWQIKGRNKINNFDDWVKLDLEYIDNWNLILDIKILLKTIPAVLFGKGAS